MSPCPRAHLSPNFGPMPRFLALTCLMLLTVIARAGGLFDAGAWAPIVLPVEP